MAKDGTVHGYAVVVVWLRQQVTPSDSCPISHQSLENRAMVDTQRTYICYYNDRCRIGYQIYRDKKYLHHR